MPLFENKTKGAVVSEDGKYRYQLWRIWDDSKPLVMFLMLNPSTADGEEDDPTIRRCIGYAKSWGCGGFYVGNLCSYRSTDPKTLLKVPDPIGANSKHIAEMVKKTALVVCAWGNSDIVKKLFSGMETMILDVLNAKAYYLELSKDGTPKHPLYLKKELEPTWWNY